MNTTGYECVLQSIDLFEKNLALSLQGKNENNFSFNALTMAEKSGYSLWHFSRLFSSNTGYTPKNYIASRVFTECAKLLCLSKNDNSYKSISFIADKAGFSDSAAFSRAFKTWCSYSPAEIRKEGNCNLITKSMLYPLKLEIKRKGSVSKDDLEAELVVCPQKYISGISFYLQEEQKSFDKLWKTFTQQKDLIKGKLLPEQFCQYTAWKPSEKGDCDDGQMLVICGVFTKEQIEQNPIFVSRIIPSGQFLHVTHRGPMSKISETYEKIYSSYFADSSLHLTSGWEYQVYQEDSTDIFIPVLEFN